MTARDRAREKVENILKLDFIPFEGYYSSWEELATQILSIPELAVLADDQSLPESPDRKSGSTEGRSFTEGNFLSYSMLPQYELAQQDMWDDGWRKTE